MIPAHWGEAEKNDNAEEDHHTILLCRYKL